MIGLFKFTFVGFVISGLILHSNILFINISIKQWLFGFSRFRFMSPTIITGSFKLRTPCKWAVNDSTKSTFFTEQEVGG